MMEKRLMAMATVIDDEKAIKEAKKNLEKALVESIKNMIKTRMALLDGGLVQIQCWIEKDNPDVQMEPEE